jgi:hypothetical protein
MWCLWSKSAKLKAYRKSVMLRRPFCASSIMTKLLSTSNRLLAFMRCSIVRSRRWRRFTTSSRRSLWNGRNILIAIEWSTYLCAPGIRYKFPRLWLKTRSIRILSFRRRSLLLWDTPLRGRMSSISNWFSTRLCFLKPFSPFCRKSWDNSVAIGICGICIYNLWRVWMCWCP